MTLYQLSGLLAACIALGGQYGFRVRSNPDQSYFIVSVALMAGVVAAVLACRAANKFFRHLDRPEYKGIVVVRRLYESAPFLYHLTVTSCVFAATLVASETILRLFASS